MQDPTPELQQDSQEDIRYMESAEEHESKPSAGDEPPEVYNNQKTNPYEYNTAGFKPEASLDA